MWRKVLTTVAAASLVFGFTTQAAAQSKAAKIRSAMAAAPASIAKNATIMDYPDASGKIATLREGSNGWTCFPSHAKSKYVTNDASCMDANFMDLIAAMMANKPVTLKGVGYCYMLSNETWESNTNYFAKGPTADNQWHHVPAHVMIAYPDKAMLAGLPTRPSLNGPYVMYAGTPYAHVMWPVK
jgi:hypothetical protein